MCVRVRARARARERARVRVCVSFQALYTSRLGPIGTKFGTHMQIHLEKVVGKISICPV